MPSVLRRAHARFLGLELLLALALIGLGLFFRHHPAPLPVDVDLELEVQRWLLPHVFLRDPIEAISTLDFTLPVIITLTVIVGIFLLLGRRLDAIIVPVAAGVASGANTAIKDWVRRPRPAGHGIHVVQHITTSFSFPSGHVTYAVTVYGLFLYLATQVRRPIHPALVWSIRAVLIILILLMPVSRVLEGEHWPSDTLGGGVEGLFWLVIFAHVYAWARARRPALLAPDER